MVQTQRLTLGVLSLRLEAVIGVRPQERLSAQPLEVSLSVEVFPEKEWSTLADTVDYSGFAQIVRDAAGREPALLEQMAQDILKQVFVYDSRLVAAEIEIRKPKAVPGALCAFVRLREER